MSIFQPNSRSIDYLAEGEAPDVVRIFPGFDEGTYEVDVMNTATENYSEAVAVVSSVQEARALVPAFLAENGFPLTLPVHVDGD